MKYVFTLLLLAACASEFHYNRNQLVEQVLTARPGKPVLSNSAFVKGEKDVWHNEIVEYDLADEKLRTNMFAMHFVCSIGGKRYKVCADKPGFCRVSYQGGFFSKKKVEEYIPIKEQYDFIVQARTTCFSELKRELDGMD